MRYCGVIGFVTTQETSPGIWKEIPVERRYFGDINRMRRTLNTGEGINDDVIVNNEISIVADPFARENMYAMRYLVWMGTKWKVASVEVNYPRLVLTLGGIYHGDET